MMTSAPILTEDNGVDWRRVASRLFPQGHDIVQEGDLLTGNGRCADQTLRVIGTTNHAEIGVEIAFAMAGLILEVVREHPGRPLLLLIDTQGQRLRRRDELLGLNRYMALLAKAIQVARDRGHRVIGLIYGQGVSGGVLASAMSADVCAALPDARIRVMSLPAMARITRIPEERLRELSRISPLFAAEANSHVRLGTLSCIWDGDLARHLKAALDCEVDGDNRSRLGHERGGRGLADPVLRRVAGDA